MHIDHMYLGVSLGSFLCTSFDSHVIWGLGRFLILWGGGGGGRRG